MNKGESNMDEQSERTADLLSKLWRSQADSIMSQLDFVNVYPDAPMREVKALRKCATQLEASAKSNGLDAVLHKEGAE